MNPQSAVETFFRSAREAFGSLEMHGGVYDQRLELLDSTNTRTVDPADFKGNSFFHAEARYAGPGWEVRITYGDREHLINTIVAIEPARGRRRPGSIWRRVLAFAVRQPIDAGYSLWEWIEAIEGDPTPAEHAGGATTSAEVDHVVRTMGATLSMYFPTITRNSDGLSNRVRQRRDQRMLGWKEKGLADRHRDAAAQAADAFRRKDYARVVELLEPLGSRLAPAQHRKLEFARSRVTG